MAGCRPTRASRWRAGATATATTASNGRIAGSTGEEFPVEVTLTPVELAGRTVLLVVWHDLSVRKHAEEERQKFVALVENSSGFIAMTTPPGRPSTSIPPAGR
jgi:hypothetical protein